MAINTDFYDYSILFDGLNGTYGAKNTNPLSDLLTKLNDYKGSVTGGSKYVTTDTQKYLSELKSSSEGLKSSLQSLLGANKAKTSVFNEKTAVSSDTDAVSVQTNKDYKNKFTDTEITVTQVASAQKNEGTALNSKGKAFDTGLNQIEIEVNGKKQSISFRVSVDDDNETVQKKMAEAINAKNIGVKANVVTDAKQKTSKLELQSVNTGDDAKNTFTVRDYSAGGGAAAKAGITIVTQSAKDAQYSINGGELKTSKTNKIDLEGGVTATLKKASDTPVKITLDTDPKNAINKVREMVNGYNALLEAAEDNKKDKGGARLQNQLKGISSSYTASLSRIGVSVSDDGYLSIDADKMQKAADQGELEKFFTQNGTSNYGFANRLSRVAEDVNKDPTSFIGKDKLHSSPTALSSIDSFSYLQSYKYNAMINTGLLFDYFF